MSQTQDSLDVAEVVRPIVVRHELLDVIADFGNEVLGFRHLEKLLMRVVQVDYFDLFKKDKVAPGERKICVRYDGIGHKIGVTLIHSCWQSNVNDESSA